MRYLLVLILVSFSLIAFSADPIIFKIKKPIDGKELQKKSPEERKIMRDKVKEFKVQFDKEEKPALMAKIKKQRAEKKVKVK